MTNETKVIIGLLKANANPANAAGMARFGISAKNTLGVTMPILRRLSRDYRRRTDVARELWSTGIHEARILTGLVADPATVTRADLNGWVTELDSWDVCDQLCLNVVCRTLFAWKLAVKWARDHREFVRRAGFATMATLAVHDQSATDDVFLALFPLIRRQATDERNFVRKAVNWALRQIGKRNEKLRRAALREAAAIAQLDSKSARWIATDAVRELANR